MSRPPARRRKQETGDAAVAPAIPASRFRGRTGYRRNARKLCAGSVTVKSVRPGLSAASPAGVSVCSTPIADSDAAPPFTEIVTAAGSSR